MGINFTALASELNTDPEQLGLAELVEAGRDADIANLLNARTGEGVGDVAADPIPRDRLLLALAPAYVAIAELSSALQAKWDRILGVIQSAAQLDIASPAVQGMLNAAAADGVLTSEQRAAFGPTRTGSRAEVLFGAGVVISHSDVAVALGRGTNG